jgi:hypothetical protein
MYGWGKASRIWEKADMNSGFRLKNLFTVDIPAVPEGNRKKADGFRQPLVVLMIIVLLR